MKINFKSISIFLISSLLTVYEFNAKNIALFSLTIENSELELDKIISKNQSILNENKHQIIKINYKKENAFYANNLNFFIPKDILPLFDSILIFIANCNYRL